MNKLWLTVKLTCLAFMFCSAMAIAAPAQFLTTLHSFVGIDGSMPYGGLVQAADGNFYGTTGFGPSISPYSGFGTVFKVTPDGTLTTLHSFNSSDGAAPYAALLQAGDGNFYGTTLEGGGTHDCDRGCGTIFQITPGGTLTTLYRFCASGAPCADGAQPFGGLVQAPDGNFYGTASTGGANGYGTVFKITPSGTLTTLHSFEFSEGVYPESGLLLARDGNFYGTANLGGANSAGTVFKITPSGTLTTLHSFQSSDGARPVGGLVQATDGNFYGTTTEGGIGNCVDGCGTVFQITPNGILTVLHLFAGPDGGVPYAALIQASNGNFYGTTYVRGAYNFGTVFEITSDGTLTTLHSFIDRPPEGFFPYAGLLQAADGNLYGTASDGGSFHYFGTIFRLVPIRPCIVCSTVE